MDILLAESYRNVAASVGCALQVAGHAVDIVHDGIQALEQVAAKHYDVVIVEHNLPRLDGANVVHVVR